MFVNILIRLNDSLLSWASPDLVGPSVSINFFSSLIRMYSMSYSSNYLSTELNCCSFSLRGLLSEFTAYAISIKFIFNNYKIKAWRHFTSARPEPVVKLVKIGCARQTWILIRASSQSSIMVSIKSKKTARILVLFLAIKASKCLAKCGQKESWQRLNNHTDVFGYSTYFKPSCWQSLNILSIFPYFRYKNCQCGLFKF